MRPKRTGSALTQARKTNLRDTLMKQLGADCWRRRSREGAKERDRPTTLGEWRVEYKSKRRKGEGEGERERQLKNRACGGYGKEIKERRGERG